MWTDPIVDELHKIREEHAKKFHNDLHAIFADFKEKEVQSGRQVISLPVIVPLIIIPTSPIIKFLLVLISIN